MLFKFAVATYLLLYYISALFWGLFSDIELTLVSSSESTSKNSHKKNWFGLPMLVVASIGFGVQMPSMVPHLQHLFRVFVEGFSRFRSVSSEILLIFCAFFLRYAT